MDDQDAPRTLDVADTTVETTTYYALRTPITVEGTRVPFETATLLVRNVEGRLTVRALPTAPGKGWAPLAAGEDAVLLAALGVSR